MFDLFTGQARHIPSHAGIPILVSSSLEAFAIAVIAVVPLLFVAEQLPQVPTMLAFVAQVPAPPPPPPPPAPTVARPKPPSESAPPVQAALAAPVEEPPAIAPPLDVAFDRGVPGGVQGGIPGGIVGGVVGGLPELPSAPPPAPPPPKRGPVRVGGQITPPQLLHRVEPQYPSIAVNAHIQGIVILEATVNEEGAVTDVKLLRSANPLLDREAEIALQQWRYAPLVLNGIPVKFVLTVTLSFFLQK